MLVLPSKTKYQKKCIPYFVTSLSVVAAMLLIMVKPNVSEHMGISARTGKNMKCAKNYVVRDHMVVCNNIASFGSFSVLANGRNDFRIKHS